MRSFRGPKRQRGWMLVNPFLTIPVVFSYDGALANEASVDDVFLLETSDVGYPYVTLLLHGDETVTGDVLDASRYGVVPVKQGAAAVSAAQARFGAGSLYFDGSTAYMTVPASTLQVAADDFTAECWLYLSAYQANSVLLSCWGAAGQRSLELVVTGTGAIFCRWSSDGTNTEATTPYAPTAVPLGSWAHIALVRSGHTLTCFINGSSGFSQQATGSIFVTSTLVNIGRSASGIWYLNGYLDDVRTTVGMPRYSGFTPSGLEAPAGVGGDPDYASVSLLLQGNAADGTTSLVDSGPSSVTVTTHGNARVSSSDPKFGIGSLYLDGIGSYVSVASSALFDFASGDLTLDCWLKPISSTGIGTLFSKRASSSVYGPVLVYIDYATNKLGVKLSTSGAAWEVELDGSRALSPGFWHHVVLVRETAAPAQDTGTNVRLYVDGYLDAAAALPSGALCSSSAAFTVGANEDGSDPLYAYVDDARATKGRCRYQSGFAPPSAPLPDTSMIVYDSILLE